MPDYSNPGGGESPDMFSDGAPAAAPKETESKGGEQTAILPKSILAGKEFKPGEEVVLKIVAIHDEDVEVEYASEEKGEEGKESPKKEMAEAYGGGGAPPSNDMASMME